MRTLKITSLLSAVLVLGACTFSGSLIETAAPVSQAVADFQEGLSPEKRALQRAVYYEQTGRVVVAWGPDDEGYDDAVAKYITGPNALHSAYWQSIVEGDYSHIIRKLSERVESVRGISLDADKCFILASGWRSCPPPKDK